MSTSYTQQASRMRLVVLAAAIVFVWMATWSTRPALSISPDELQSSGGNNIINLHSQKCLAAPSDPAAENVPVMQATCSPALNQQWNLVGMGNGYYEIIAQHSGKCLDVEFKHVEENYDLVQATCVGNGSQLWRLQSLGNYTELMARSSGASHAAAPLNVGTYFQIVAQHSGKCMDLDGWSHGEGAHIIHYPCAPSNNDNQAWAFGGASSGYATATPVQPSLINFWADQPTIRQGDCTTLHWDAENVRAVYLDGQGKPGHASQQVCPAATTTFRLTVVTSDGNVDRTVMVTVLPRPSAPTIQYFSADRTLVTRGECTVLRWDVDNASAVYLDGQSRAATDVQQVCPVSPTAYTLRAVSDGGVDERSVTVGVAEPAVANHTPTISRTPTRTPTLTPTPTATPTATSNATIPFLCEGFGRCAEDVADKSDLWLVGLKWNPAPEAFKPFNLTLTVRNGGGKRYEPGDGAYQVEVTFIFPLGDGLTYYFDSADPSSSASMTPKRLTAIDPNQSIDITLSDLSFPTGLDNGAVQVRLIPKSPDFDSDNNQKVDHLTIAGPHLMGAYQCASTALAAYTGGLLGAAEKGWLAVAKSTATSIVKKKTVEAGLCLYNGDRKCAVNTVANMVSLLRPEKVGDLIAFVVEAAGSSFKDAMGCSLEVLKFGLDLIAQHDASGGKVNGVVVASPVYILATDRQGRRVGFLDDGRLVEEMAGAHVARLGEEKLIVYPGDATSEIKVKGLSDGTFTLLMTLSKNDAAVQTEYLAVRTNSKMAGTIHASDEHYALNIDTNGTGVVDVVRAPDSINVMGGQVQDNSRALGTAALVVLVSMVAFSGVLWLARHPHQDAAMLYGLAKPVALAGRGRQIILGRDARSSLAIADPEVSLRHAQIMHSGNTFILYDLGSKNGTFVNGQRVSQRVLQAGDCIRIGQTELVFQMRAAAAHRNKG